MVVFEVIARGRFLYVFDELLDALRCFWLGAGPEGIDRKKDRKSNECTGAIAPFLDEWRHILCIGFLHFLALRMGSVERVIEAAIFAGGDGNLLTAIAIEGLFDVRVFIAKSMGFHDPMVDLDEAGDLLFNGLEALGGKEHIDTEMARELEILDHLLRRGNSKHRLGLGEAHMAFINDEQGADALWTAPSVIEAPDAENGAFDFGGDR